MTLDTDDRREVAQTDGQTSLSDVEDEGDEDVETTTVGDRIRDVLDHDEIHGIQATYRTETAVYFIVTRTTSWSSVDEDGADDVDVLDKRTVVLDLDNEEVRVTDNGLWTLADETVAGDMARTTARASSDMSGVVDADGPLSVSSTDEVDVDGVLAHEVPVPEGERTQQDLDKMRRHHGISPSRPWGYGGGPPPEVDEVVDRLVDVDLDPADHLFRLRWGRKDPFDTVDKTRDPPARGRPVDDLVGNYGVDVLSRDEGLVVVDVDYPDEFDGVELPDTFAVSSPHGGDDRRHLVFYCEDKGDLAERLDTWSLQELPWGDLWFGGNRYIVGAGCQLSAYGCDHEVDRDSPECCAACDDEDGGYYEVVDEAPIREVDADDVLDLIPDEVVEDREARREASADHDLSDDVPASDGVRAGCCGRVVDEDDVEDELKDIGDGYICRRGYGCAEGDE
jgi:hypothetical protein